MCLYLARLWAGRSMIVAFLGHIHLLFSNPDLHLLSGPCKTYACKIYETCYIFFNSKEEGKDQELIQPSVTYFQTDTN